MERAVVLLTLVATVFSAKLNVPRLLLPYYSTVATNFTLEVDDGCFKWRSTRPEIASVEATGISECSKSAIVSAASRVSAKKTAIIIAEDPVSGFQLRCDVIVDEIYTIEIETTTHELYLDDSPEEFVLRALTDENDVFSTLEGVAFDWNLLPDKESGQKNLAPANNILRFISFSESNYVTYQYITTLEQSGKRGDRILVRGVRTGSARVNVRLVDPVYKNVKDASVRIIVMANIQLSPPIVYLLQHTTVKYKVELIKQAHVQEIEMPSPQYYIEVVNQTIASFETETSTALALQYGDTELKLKDRHINIPGIFREPSAAIVVVTPGYLEFVVLPGRVWVLETNRMYEIYIDIYDKESHKIYPSDNIVVLAEFVKTYFDVQYSSPNGTYHIVRTLKRGFTDIDGTLESVTTTNWVKQHKFDPPIQGTQEVEIYDPVKVTPPIVVLPWEPNRNIHYSYALTVTGGSGNYTWTSVLTNVATVNMKGVIRTATNTGHTEVKVADTRNTAHFDTMLVYVLPPHSMEFLSSIVEAEIGTNLDLPLAVYALLDGKPVKFANCHKMPFAVTVKDEKIFTHIAESAPILDGSCATIRVKAESLGDTVVTVRYEYMNIKLQASVTIAAYKPLKPIDPEELTLVTPFSSRDVIFEGGPQPWVLDKSTYFEKVTPEKPSLIKLTPLKAYESMRTLHVFRVLCTSLGEQTLTLEVYNKPSLKNKFPATDTASIKFACAEPAGMRLIPHVTHPKGLPPCPISPEFDEPVPVHSYRDLPMVVSLFDAENRKFDNFSSLILDWSMSDEKLAAFQGGDKMTTDVIMGDSGTRMFRSYKIVSMKSKPDQLTISAGASTYNAFNSKFVPELAKLNKPISASKVLNLVEDALIDPSQLTIYNHGTNKATLNVQRGSGHFHLDHGDFGLTKISYDPKQRNIQFFPQEEGRFEMTAYDLCLEADQPARATVFISDVHQIILNVRDKVEIQHEIKAHVQVWDKNRQPIPAKYFSLMKLQARAGSEIINVRPTLDRTSDPNTAVYIVQGASLGNTVLKFTGAQKSGRIVSSNVQDVQVFPPLRLEPRNITLLVGAIFQVTAHGGPQPQSDIQFFIGNSTVAEISVSGLVDAATVGVTTVVGKAVGVDGDGGSMVYSQDMVTVYVVELDGIKIFAPLKRLQTGTQMPVYAMPMYAVGQNENETPFTFGSAVPPLSFTWSISNEQVADLKPLFYKSGIQPSEEGNFAMRFFAEEPGHVTVRLHVNTNEGSYNQVRTGARLVDQVQLQVFEKLKVINPDVCDGTLLMSPNTAANVKTNRDGSTAKMSYSLQSSNLNAQTIVSVDKFGHLVSGSETGEVPLVVTAYESFDVNQTIVILVKVKPISYIMLNVDTVIHTQGESKLATLPVGSVVHFTVSFHDTVGEKFYATNSKIGVRSNRFDLLQISHGSDNNTLVATATNIGQTVFKVWDKNSPHLADYVGITVGYAIKPSLTTAMLGDVICFHCPLSSKDAHYGTWSTSNSVLGVDRHNGIAMTTQVGSSIVKYSVMESITTHTQVNVIPITRVTLNADHIPFLTNVPSKLRSVTVPITLEDKKGRKQSSLIGDNCNNMLVSEGFKAWRLPLRCEVTMSRSHPQVIVEDLVKVEAEFDVHSGNYLCRLTPSSTSDTNQLISTLDTQIKLRVFVSERDGQQELVTSYIALPFMSAFYVQTPEVVVSNTIPTTNMRITASEKVLQDLQVMSLDPTLVTVSSPERDPQGDQLAFYPITLKLTSGLWDRSQLETSIEVRSKLTGQKQLIPVNVKLVGHKADAKEHMHTTWSDLLLTLANNYHNIVFLMLCVIATISCILIAYHAVVGSRFQSASMQTGVYATPSRSPSQEAIQQSPWSSPTGSGSPTSPSRLWSVDYGPYDNSSLFRRSPYAHSPGKK